MSGAVQSFAAQSAMSAYTLAYQVSPIMFVGGIATGTSGGILPIAGLTGQLAAFVQGVVSNGFTLNDFFAQYLVIPGGTMVNQSIATYPFANQSVAANAGIRQPLTLSLQMIAPVNDNFGYLTKSALFSSLVQSFTQHNALGGLYNIATPAMLYTNGVMISMSHMPNDGNQQQIMFELDFFFPLVTQAQAAQAQGSLFQSATNGTQISGTPSYSGSQAAGNTNFSGLPAAVVPVTQTPLSSP